MAGSRSGMAFRDGTTVTTSHDVDQVQARNERASMYKVELRRHAGRARPACRGSVCGHPPRPSNPSWRMRYRVIVEPSAGRGIREAFRWIETNRSAIRTGDQPGGAGRVG